MADRQPVFSEKEVSEIMQRAAELQEKEQASYTRGVTREELLRIADELGVEPAVLTRAIDEQLERKGKKPFHFVAEEERVVEGEISPDDFDLILNDLSKVRGPRGGPVQVGKTVRTQTFAGGSIQNVEITSRKGRTRIKVRHFPFLPIFATLYPAFIGTVLSTALMAHGMAGVALAIATGLFALALVAMRMWIGRGSRGTSELADKLQKTISDELAQQASSPARAEETAAVHQRIGEQL